MKSKLYGDGFDKYGNKLIKTLRVMIDDKPGGFAGLAAIIGESGALLGDIKKIRMTSQHIIRDVTVYLDTDDQLKQIIRSIKKAHGLRILEVRDEVMEKHEGGKIATVSRVRIASISDLRTIYTPGVAQICRAIAQDERVAYDYTSIWNTVAIVTNGTAILGMGDIGVAAGMPVMEGKAAILNRMAGLSAVPILINSHRTATIVRAVQAIAPTFGAIQLEDIAAPQCFEVEQQLAALLDRPVFHDDQHGTAVVVTATLMTALRLTRRKVSGVRVVISGTGAAGIATAKMLLRLCVGHIVLCDRAGALYHERRRDMNRFKKEIARLTNQEKIKGDLQTAMAGADVFIGVSAPNLVSKDMVKRMAKDPIVFALANPVPEIQPAAAIEAGAAVASDGRSINNALAFPGIFRGALAVRAREINDEMKLAAAKSLHQQTGKHELVPDFMKRDVHHRVAEAVSKAAITTKAARTSLRLNRRLR